MRTQSVVAVTTAVILVTVVVSGPLVAAVDLTTDEGFSGANLGEGRATVDEVTLPSRVVFERGDFGSGSYYLRIPDATVELRDVVGRPILSYELAIEELGLTKSAITVLSSRHDDAVVLSLQDAAFGSGQLANESYGGRLRVDVRYGGAEHVLATRNVTIEVIE